MVLATRFFRCLGRWVHAVVTKEQRERVTKHIFAASFLSKRQMPPAKYLPGYNPSQDRGNKVQHSDWTRRSSRRNASHKTTEFFQRKMKQRKRRRRRKNDWEDESESDGEGFMLSARMTKKLSTVRCIAVGGGRRLGLLRCAHPLRVLLSPCWYAARDCASVLAQHHEKEVHVRHGVRGGGRGQGCRQGRR